MAPDQRRRWSFLLRPDCPGCIPSGMRSISPTSLRSCTTRLSSAFVRLFGFYRVVAGPHGGGRAHPLPRPGSFRCGRVVGADPCWCAAGAQAKQVITGAEVIACGQWNSRPPHRRVLSDDQVRRVLAFLPCRATSGAAHGPAVVVVGVRCGGRLIRTLGCVWVVVASGFSRRRLG
jgi:hypothetical protein